MTSPVLMPICRPGKWTPAARDRPHAARVGQGQAGANRALGIVLVGVGHAEDGHEAVAHDLRDCAAVLLDDQAQLGHPRPDGAEHVLRVEALGQRRVAGKVGEEDGDDLAFRAGLRLAAGRAEDGAWR